MNVRKECDFCVCGGGLAGISAAIAAARQGAKVILCNDRPILGGNSSSEFRVWICGATGLGNNRYADEGGVIGEITLESLFRNKEGNPLLWDITLLDFVKREKNIELLQNARVVKAFTSRKRIKRILVTQHTTETEYEIAASLFADCTGDGYLAALAGAQSVSDPTPEGVEPDVPEWKDADYSLGCTVFFYKKRCDAPIRFIPPDFAYRREEIEQMLLHTGKTVTLEMNGCDYWWIEYGGALDCIQNSEEIQYELLRIVYGIWDYIKNSGKFDADTYTLEWVGMLPGRRASRRIRAQYMLTAQDVIEQRAFPDAVAYGGWPIDVHPSAGFFDAREPCKQIDVSVYPIPLRSLLSEDLDNLMLAGRDVGMSRLAMASARVMKTCALMGQAIGTAATLAKKNDLPPNRFDAALVHEMQQQLLRDDVWLIGIPNQDDADLARTASVKAGGKLDFSACQNGSFMPLCEDVCIVLPPLPQEASVRLPVKQDEPRSVTVETFSSSRLQNHDLFMRIGEQSVAPDECGMVQINGPWGEYNTILRLTACAGSELGLSDLELPGALGVISRTAKGMRIFRPAVRVDGFSPYRAENLIDGYNRPLGHVHAWVAPLSDETSYVTFTLSAPREIREVHVYFDCSLFRGINNLRPAYSDPEWSEMPPNLAKNITFEFIGDACSERLEVRENRLRHLVIHTQAEGVKQIRIAVNDSWGGKIAVIYEVRIYGKKTSGGSR